MKNHEILQDAIGLIDDELIINAKPNTALKKGTPLWVRWVAAAACLALLLSFGWQIIPGLGATKVRIAENVWLKEDFDAFSLSYKSSAPATLSSVSDARIVRLSTTVTETEPQPMLKTHPLIISQDQTYKFQNLIASRYAVYHSETGIPVFYDTLEDRLVDLQERIIGDTSDQLNAWKEEAKTVANAEYPGFLSSVINQQLLDRYVTLYLTKCTSEQWDNLVSSVPDTDFISLPPEAENPNAKTDEFWQICSQIYTLTHKRLHNEFADKNYSIVIMGIDEKNGLCIVKTTNIMGVFVGQYIYDIRTDTVTALSQEFDINQDDSFLRFSSDGTIATVVSPSYSSSKEYAENHYYFSSYANRDLRSCVDRLVVYFGEQRGVFFLEKGTAQKLSHVPDEGLSSSELFISKNSKILYNKVMEDPSNGKKFYVSDSVWYNRLKLYNKDTDHWAFTPINKDLTLGKELILQGNFVQFAADETVAIMERGGSYYAYSLETGEDVTEKARNEAIAMYAHELLSVTLENGILFTANLFTGEKKAIAAADQYILTDDGAFAFTYCEGTNYVTCINIASMDSCAIGIDDELLSQLFSTNNTVLQMSYQETENTLLISYYFKEDLPTYAESDVNFYKTIAKLPAYHESTSPIPTNPTVIDTLKISEEVMDVFRKAASNYHNVPSEDLKLSELCPYNTTRAEIFGYLGLTEPENYLDVNGVEFILYEDDDETLILTIWEGWPLYDYQGWYCGFSITHTINGIPYDYVFRN